MDPLGAYLTPTPEVPPTLEVPFKGIPLLSYRGLDPGLMEGVGLLQRLLGGLRRLLESIFYEENSLSHIGLGPIKSVVLGSPRIQPNGSR